ncbi:OmpA family protein [Flavobacterium sp.]|jgi:outer membrane protein OmpA-like peptidoglycan-associated protein|uniref:OmpA family protein n=1 Tax=Flavobacterium sp. TaxID=239 RepID=UPI0037C05420
MKKKILLLLFIVVHFSNAQERFVVYFDNNKFELNKTEQAKFDKWILENKTSKILSITGSTDEVGSSGFNDTLSQKRVNSIYSKVNGKIKIREDFKSISLGEKGATSPNKAENRKAIIHYILEKDLARENEILGIKPKVVVEEEIVPIEEETMNFPEGATLEDKIGLSTKGTLIRLEDINFHINTFAIIPSSKKSIDELIYVLKKYPKLKIEIQGHICCVNKDARNLSLDRARQVKRILMSEGIDDKRVKVKGFGVSKPKFAIPEKSEFEAGRNRRVEIMILDK